MSATVGAALKKIAVSLLLDKKSREKLVCILLAIVCMVCLPVLGVQAVFTGADFSQADYDTLAESALESMPEETKTELFQMEQTALAVQQLLEAMGCDARQVQGSQVLYLLALYEQSREPDFVEKLAGCFSPGQTDDQLIQRVNGTFGTTLTAEEYMALLLLAYKELVQVALSQVGNVGGEPYWSWYGFDSRVEWCACFVSWCADQCGYIEAGLIPKFAGCVQGSNWFMVRDAWEDKDYTPSPGDIIFFDWDSPGTSAGPQDGEPDHVGIVVEVRNGRVYTVEGNSGDACRENSYPVGYYEIYGYGLPNAIGEPV